MLCETCEPSLFFQSPSGCSSHRVSPLAVSRTSICISSALRNYKSHFPVETTSNWHSGVFFSNPKWCTMCSSPLGRHYRFKSTRAARSSAPPQGTGCLKTSQETFVPLVQAKWLYHTPARDQLTRREMRVWIHSILRYLPQEKGRELILRMHWLKNTFSRENTIHMYIERFQNLIIWHTVNNSGIFKRWELRNKVEVIFRKKKDTSCITKR